MRRNLDDIEIVEPPIGELTKTRSSFKTACLTGCGCIFLFVIAIVVGLWLLIGRGPQTMTLPPINFPPDIPVYDKDNIIGVNFISGKYKNRSVELASLFPKVILSPLLLSVQRDNINDMVSNLSEIEPPFIQRLWQLITSPSEEWRDTVQINWQNIDAESNFVLTYYKKELVKQEYKISDEKKDSKQQQFSFKKGDIDGLLIIRGAINKSGIAYMTLTVNFFSNSNTTNATVK